jgi:hypothetical protein
MPRVCSAGVASSTALFGAAVACSVVFASPAPAQVEPQPVIAQHDVPAVDADAWLDDAIARLDADDLETRDNAEEEIAFSGRVTLRMLSRRLAPGAAELSAEQRERLTKVALRAFAGAPRAAMGVEFARFDRGVDGVEIGRALPNFDSARVLQPGDIIKAMDGVPVLNNLDARAAIISHDPGEEVTIQLVRRGETITVRCALGHYTNLRNAANLDSATLMAAWDVRCRREFAAVADEAADGAGGAEQADEPVIEPGLSPEDWMRIEDLARRQFVRAHLATPQPVGPFDSKRPAETDASDITLAAGGSMRRFENEGDPSFSGVPRRLSGRALQIQQEIDQFSQAINRNSELIRDGNLPQVQRRALADQNSQLRQLIQMRRVELRRLQSSELRNLPKMP